MSENAASPTQESGAFSMILFWIAILCVAVPCYMIQGSYLVNGNISWLLMAAERLLQGQSMSVHIYETNPPLSIIIYIPHVIAAKLFGIPLPVASYYVTSLFVIFSVITMNALVRHLSYISDTQRYCFIACYTLSVTIITTVFYSDREHMILLGLAPFVFTQFLLLHRIELPKILVYVVFIIGAFCVLVKPHYGLLPTVFLMTRLIKHRQINFFKAPDFQVLAIMTLLYIGVITIFFYDYVTIIFPDVATLYVNSGSDFLSILNASQIHMLAYVAFFFFELFREDLSKQQKSLVLFMYGCCMMCLVPYYVQLKGFYNHLIPAYAFFMMGLCLTLMFRSENLIKIKNLSFLQFIIPFAALMSVANAISPLNTDFPKHKNIPDMPVTKVLEEKCPKPCTFFAFHGDIEIMNPTAAYMGYTHGSRFPVYWFLPQVLRSLEDESQRENGQTLMNKYTQMLAEDLEYYKPDILLIAQDIPVAYLTTFNFMSFFALNENVKEQFEQHYEKDGVLEFDRAQYFAGTTLEYSYTLKFQIYRRKPNP